jgi:hypothetical protein
MKRAVLFLLLVCLVAPAYAGFRAEKIEEGVYFVSYERGRWTTGTVLDTAAKAVRKLNKKSHQLCLGEGYSYMRFATLGEIAEDEVLSGAWDVAVGDQPADAFQSSGGDDGLPAKVHKSSRILFLSDTPVEGFELCSDSTGTGGS